MNNNKFLLLVLSGLLCAIGLMVPMCMPKIVLGPMSFTLASHVAVFLAMFISPILAIAVCIGTTLGFFLTTPLIIAIRAASHIVFAVVGAYLLKKYPQILDKAGSATIFNVVLAAMHAICEVLVVTPFFFAGLAFNQEQLAVGYITSVLLLVGGGTVIHSFIDCNIALLIWKPLTKAIPSIRELK